MKAISGVMLLALAAMAMANPDLTADKKRYAKLEAAYTKSKAASQKAPKDSKLKSAYLKATIAFADDVLFTPILTPKEKYPKALRLYREVRKIDSKNKHAAKQIKLIEDIYKSMGRPVPK